TFHHICAINNYVFLPIIVLQNVYGERHVALLLLMNVGSTIGFWTIGILTLTGGGSLSKTFKNIFTINIAAVMAALAVALLHIPVPEALDYTFKYLGNITIPLMLILIGVALVGCFKGMVENWRDMLLLSAIRLIVIPVTLLVLLRLLMLPTEVYQVTAVVALMPAASVSVLIAKRYGGDSDFAGRAILITTFLSLGTIPLLMGFFLPN
ncbi:MAG: AEC family transporter, partial [Victivallales bacterium]|nr:AEC family transporter [Victivallales bacterium]